MKVVLGQYPDDVIAHISDPRTGIQRACKWPPTINEIVCACEVQMQHMAKVKRLRNWGKNEARALEPPRAPRPTYEQLKAKYGDDFGIAAPKKPEPEKAPSWESIVTAYQADPDRLRNLLRLAGADPEQIE